MSFKDIIASQVANVFDNILADDLENVYYEVVKENESYDPTNPNVKSEVSTRVGTIEVVLSPYGALFGGDPMITREVFTGKLSCTMQVADLTKYNIIPKNADRIIRNLESGEEIWNIDGIRSDPMNVTYQFLISKP